MRLAFVSEHLPEPEGSATGRLVLAAAEGLIAEGHDVRMLSWRPAPPTGDLPSWCEWRPLPPESRARTRGRALVRPRWDATRLGWRVPEDAVAIAEEFPSYAAVAHADRRVFTPHFSVRLDLAAVAGIRPKHVQDLRAESYAGRHARLVVTYSPRVAAAFPRAVTVPAPVRLPAQPLPLVAEPAAVLAADWRWRPNVVALRRLLAGWPRVRAAVPHARLLLAGRGDPGVGTGDGVEVLGYVARSVDVLARAAVLAFPCPPSSGPKVKVLEALAAGLPVVTTPAGAEGVAGAGDALAVAGSADEFPDLLAAVLADEDRRTAMAAAGRAAVEIHHAPRPAARARVAALAAAFGG